MSISQKTLSNIESDKSVPTVDQLAMMGKLYGLNIIELLSHHGITFNRHDQEGGESGVINYHNYLREMKELHEQLLKEKDSRIALLEEYLERLKEEQNPKKEG